MKNTMKYAFTSAVFAVSVPFAGAAEKTTENVKQCSEVYESASKTIAQSPEKVLELVSKLVAANEACAGEVVKAAIVTTKADKALVSQIVETAATAAPKQISKIGASAMAVAPDASTEIAKVLNKVNANLGTAQGRAVHPLDFPEANGTGSDGPGGSGHPIVGPPAGGPAGSGIGGAAGTQSEGNSITNTPPGATR